MDTSMGHVKSVWDESDAPTGNVKESEFNCMNEICPKICY